VNGEIHSAVEERFFDFLDKHSLDVDDRPMSS
jgi:hypothetical protein